MRFPFPIDVNPTEQERPKPEYYEDDEHAE